MINLIIRVPIPQQCSHIQFFIIGDRTTITGFIFYQESIPCLVMSVESRDWVCTRYYVTLFELRRYLSDKLPSYLCDSSSQGSCHLDICFFDFFIGKHSYYSARSIWAAALCKFWYRIWDTYYYHAMVQHRKHHGNCSTLLTAVNRGSTGKNRTNFSY